MLEWINKKDNTGKILKKLDLIEKLLKGIMEDMK